MTKLSTRRVNTAGKNPAVNNNTAANARSKRYHNGIASSLCGTRNSLAPSGSVRIVFNVNVVNTETI
jgi:hypothetical protein